MKGDYSLGFRVFQVIGFNVEASECRSLVVHVLAVGFIGLQA